MANINPARVTEAFAEAGYRLAEFQNRLWRRFRPEVDTRTPEQLAYNYEFLLRAGYTPAEARWITTGEGPRPPRRPRRPRP